MCIVQCGCVEWLSLDISGFLKSWKLFGFDATKSSKVIENVGEN